MSAASARLSSSVTTSKSKSPTISLGSFPTSPSDMLDKIKKADQDLDALLAKQPFILKLERQSGVKKTHMVYGLAGVLVFFLLFQVATGLVLSLALFGYPLLLTLEAVEGHDKAKDAHILSYWAVIATLHLMEVLLPFTKKYIPFYAFLKLTLAVWMYLPQTKGSLLVYDLAFKPALTQIKSAKKSATTTAAKSVPVKKSSSDAGDD